MKHARADYNGRFVDTHGKIPEDEPVFLIRGQDPDASATLRAYAGYVQARGASADLVSAVLGHADEMDAWPVKKEVADL